MSIYDRDYMKRPADDDGTGDPSSSSDSKAEELAQRFFRKHPRFLLCCGVVIGILMVIALAVAKFSNAAH